MIVPKWRFPEFQNEIEWRKISFIDVADRSIKWSFTGGPFGSNLKASDYVNKGIRVIQLQNIGDGEFIDDYKIFTSEEKADELISCNIYPDEIILSKMGDPVGRACLIPNFSNRYVMCSDGIRLVVDENKYSKYFIYGLINSKHFRPLVEKTATGSTRKRIGLEELKELPIIVPQDLKEQQKIASCLSSLDDLITAHTQKLDGLKAHKKGLMQQLFPAEGEKVPKLRFAEFNSAWKKRKLSDLIDLQSGYAFQSEYFSNEGLKLVTPKNFTKEGYGIFTNENTKFTTEEADVKYVCKAGDLLLLLTDLTPTCELLGKPLLLKISEGDVLLNQRIAKIVQKKNIEISFLHCFFATDIFHKRITDTATGSTVRHSSNSIVLNTELFIPLLNEQQKIASCLSSLDELIIAQAEKIEQLKMHKKGLMQGLFPNVNDVNL